MIRIETADLSQRNQAEIFIELLNAYANDPMGGGEPLAEQTRLNLVATLNTHSGATTILAYADQLAIGLCNCFDAFSTFACQPILNIHDIYVSETYRRQGVARLLLNHAEQIALDKGCCKMTLEVLNRNETAKSIYQQFGFKPYQLNENFGNAEFWQKDF